MTEDTTQSLGYAPPTGKLKLSFEWLVFVGFGVLSSAWIGYVISGGQFLQSIVAGLSALFFHFCFYFMVGTKRILGSRDTRSTRIAMAVVLGCGIGWHFRLDSEAAFQAAFGIDPPLGISGLQVDKHGLSGFTDEVILLQFIADTQTIDKLVASRSFDKDEQVVALNEDVGAGWAGLWSALFSHITVIGGTSWQNVMPLNKPRVYRWEDSTNKIRQTILLWDEETGQAYVVYTLG